MKIQKDTKETIIMVIIVIIVVYVLLWLTYPRNVEQPLPEPLDLPSVTEEVPTSDANGEAPPPSPDQSL